MSEHTIRGSACHSNPPTYSWRCSCEWSYSGESESECRAAVQGHRAVVAIEAARRASSEACDE